MMEIVVGVICNHSAEWFLDELFNGIDLDYETHCAECLNEYHDSCWETVGNETLLIGFVKCKPNDSEVWFTQYNGSVGSFAFKPDETAEYSAIVRETYAQIVHSQWMAQCHKCSPCYPGQGDLDTPGNLWAFCLPPSMFGDSDMFDVSRIKEI